MIFTLLVEEEGQKPIKKDFMSASPCVEAMARGINHYIENNKSCTLSVSDSLGRLMVREKIVKV